MNCLVCGINTIGFAVPAIEDKDSEKVVIGYHICNVVGDIVHDQPALILKYDINDMQYGLQFNI